MSKAYYLSVACHNAALLNVKLGRWADAQELVDEGIEFTKAVRWDIALENENLVALMKAVVECHCMEMVTISGIDFQTRKVWRRVKKRGFLETRWYASALNFADVWGGSTTPETGHYEGLLADLNHFMKRVAMALIVVGNETEGIDLSNNGINVNSISMLVHALCKTDRDAAELPQEEEEEVSSDGEGFADEDED
eukprot:Skav201313  [mRNA]  locus=scaffold1490:122454:127341:- [translate_table: standard]